MHGDKEQKWNMTTTKMTTYTGSLVNGHTRTFLRWKLAYSRWQTIAQRIFYDKYISKEQLLEPIVIRNIFQPFNILWWPAATVFIKPIGEKCMHWSGAKFLVKSMENEGISDRNTQFNNIFDTLTCTWICLRR